MKDKSIIFALLLGLIVTSCNDYLEVQSPSEYDDKTVYSNVSLAEDAVINIYSYFAQTNSHRARYMP